MKTTIWLNKSAFKLYKSGLDLARTVRLGRSLKVSVWPYSESIDNDGYEYRISVLWFGRDGELAILPRGAHIEFDDDGSWLDFNISPEALFPDELKLTENKLIRLLNVFWERRNESTTIAKEIVDKKYQDYLTYLKRKEL